MDSRDPTPINSISAPTPFGSAAAPPPPTNPPSLSPFAPNPNPSSISQPVQLSFESHAPSPPGSQTPGSQGPGSYFLNSHGNSGEPMKKKRGRPRKYGPDGGMALALRPGSSASGGFDGPASDPAFKRKGRPPGSGRKKQLEALGKNLEQITFLLENFIHTFGMRKIMHANLGHRTCREQSVKKRYVVTSCRY